MGQGRTPICSMGGIIVNENWKDYRTGPLPERFPLATALTPWQESADPVYESGDALSKGTLFPGLDLPFMNVVNGDLPQNPQTEMMAIDFVAHELGLYLDTHKDDAEAFALFQSFLALQKEARKRYVELCGVIQKRDLRTAERYTWLCDPWPWDYSGRKES